MTINNDFRSENVCEKKPANRKLSILAYTHNSGMPMSIFRQLKPRIYLSRYLAQSISFISMCRSVINLKAFVLEGLRKTQQKY
jgi:hypothetical protein